jgi:hypothetical protein
MDVLRAVRDHLQDVYPHVEVGGRPATVPDGMAWATVWNTDTRPPDEANDVETYDLSLFTIVQVKTIGWTWRQTSDVAALLDRTIRDGLTVPDATVHLVQRERTSGPTRDDTAHPEPGLYLHDNWYRIDHSPDLQEAS